MMELAQFFFGNFWHWLLATVWLVLIVVGLKRKN